MKIEICEITKAHRLVKVTSRGRVYAAVYAEPFPTRESATQDFKNDRDHKNFLPYNESAGCFVEEKIEE